MQLGKNSNEREKLLVRGSSPCTAAPEKITKKIKTWRLKNTNEAAELTFGRSWIRNWSWEIGGKMQGIRRWRLGWGTGSARKQWGQGMRFSNGLKQKKAAQRVHWIQKWTHLPFIFSWKFVRKKRENDFFTNFALISAILEKHEKITKSPYKRAFLVLQKEKKLSQRSLKPRFLIDFDVFKSWTSFSRRAVRLHGRSDGFNHNTVAEPAQSLKGGLFGADLWIFKFWFADSKFWFHFSVVDFQSFICGVSNFWSFHLWIVKVLFANLQICILHLCIFKLLFADFQFWVGFCSCGFSNFYLMSSIL